MPPKTHSTSYTIGQYLFLLMQIIYFLFPYKNSWVFQFRFGIWTEECQEYSRDTLNRNTGCWFPRTFINSKGFEQLAVHVNGSSKHSAIKPFDQLFAPHSIGKPDLTQHWNNGRAQSWYWKGSCYFSNIKRPYNQHEKKKTKAVIRPLTHLFWPWEDVEWPSWPHP